MKVLLHLFLIGFMYQSFAQVRDTYSDTWVSVDDLNRKSPDNSSTGGPKSNKTVGLFYYIWSEETPAWPIKDISKILAGQDTWGGKGAFHHYGESLYGYYSSSDEFVIRKHMQMFADAGIDYIFLDNTNGPSYTYESTYKKIFAVLDDMKAKGVKTPKVSFVVNSSMDPTIETIYSALYSKNLYSQHWFYWQGKPLILGTYNGSNSAISNFFTFKRSWAWTSQPWFTNSAGKNCWPWLDDYPQKAGLDGNGAVEQMTVAAAHHPHGQYAIGKSTGADRTQNPVYGTDGKYFGLQWDRALQVNPSMIMVTQWNEWIAQRFIKGDPVFNQPIDYMARKPISNGESQFVDVYTPEYARDLEPMRTGYRDNMYLQLANNIRKYKGGRPFRQATNPTSITMNTSFDQWSNVGPQYLDDINDAQSRNHVSFGSDLTYKNTTGRNDIDEMKISYDNTYIYFYAKTNGNLTPHTDARWMNLLINSDANYATGWEGYDFIVNNTVNSAISTTLKKNSGGTFSWTNSENITYAFTGNEIHIRVPASSLGINTANPFTLDFKWVDNSIQSGDIIDLYVDGDAAPNNRYNNRYIGIGTVNNPTSWDFNTSGDFEGWAMANNTTGAANGYTLAVTATGSDPYILSPGSLNVSASQYPYMYIRMRNFTSQTQGEFFWTTNTSPAFDGTKHVLFTLPPNDGNYYDVLIPLSGVASWSNAITQIRIDPIASGSSGEIRYDHISFEKTNQLDCAGVWQGTSTPATPSISIALTAGTNPSCENSAQTFTATITNGGSAPSYQWKVNNVTKGSNTSTYSSSALSNSDVVTCVLTSNVICATTTSKTSNAITVTRNALVTPTISIALTTGTNPSCENTSQTFTATRTNGGATPSYQWKVNGTNTGTNSATFTSSTLADNAIVSCVLTSNAICASTTTANSNSITVTRNAVITPTLSIALTTGTNPSCENTSQTFTATRTNGGATPSYQWKVNGTNAGMNSATFTSSTLADNAIVSCVLTSNASCASTTTANSNSITLTRNALVTPIISIALTTGTNPSCENTAQTFTATRTNGGTTPSYQWKVNGANTGTNSATFTSSTLADNAIVTCVLTSNASCASTTTANSNSITVTRNALVTPTISIALTTGINPSCENTVQTFTATRTNGGTTPSYQWKVNGTNTGTNSATFTSSTLADNAIVTCVLTSNASCASTTTATSNSITLTRNAVIAPIISIALTTGTNPSCENTAQTFTATRTNGGTTPSYQWKVNGTNAGTNSATFTSSALANNSVVTCVLTSNASCASTTTATSNSITVTRNALVTPTISIALTTGINPSCENTVQTFTATRTNGGTTPSYQWKVNGTNAGTNSSTFTSSTLADNAIVSCVLTSNASCASTTTATSNSITLTRNAVIAPTINIALTTGTNPSCAGESQTFTATRTNGGATPSYQWKVNGTNAGTNSSTFTSSTLADNAIVTCVLTSNATCASTTTANSNSITQIVKTIPVVNAGADQYKTTTSSTLSGSGTAAGETGTWTTTSTAVISNPSNRLSAVSGITNASTTFRWTVSNGACSSFDEVDIYYGTAPVITSITGSDEIIPGISYRWVLKIHF